MYNISKTFLFSASHILRGLPTDHECANLHGHNYVVKIELQGEELDEHGFVKDYGDLAPVKKWLDEHFDHAHICMDADEAFRAEEMKMWVQVGTDFLRQKTVVIGSQTSAECIAKFIYDVWKEPIPQLTAVHVSETGKTWAIYR